MDQVPLVVAPVRPLNSVKLNANVAKKSKSASKRPALNVSAARRKRSLLTPPTNSQRVRVLFKHFHQYYSFGIENKLTNFFLFIIVAPNTKCRLRLLRQERIKDYILMEQEFIQN